MTQKQVTAIPGAVVIVYLPRLGVTHKGIFDWASNVIHNSKAARTAIRSRLAEFSEGQPYNIEWVPQTQQEQAAVVERATGLIGKYLFRLDIWNCEDFVNWCRKGVAYSETRALVGGLVIVGIVTLAVHLLSKRA